jgi:hypothetical protein
MLDARIFRDSDSTYLASALKVVPPVTNLKLPTIKGRRSKYPAEPEVVEEIARRYGVGSSLQRLVTALKGLTKS